jgi:hypothetical protein
MATGQECLKIEDDANKIGLPAEAERDHRQSTLPSSLVAITKPGTECVLEFVN